MRDESAAATLRRQNKIDEELGSSAGTLTDIKRYSDTDLQEGGGLRTRREFRQTGRMT